MPADALETRLHDLGEFIRDQRRNARLSLRKLSEAAGISNPYLSQIERGLRKPSAEILQAIAKGLRISAETLYVRAGILDERTDDAPDVVDALLNDPTLNDRQKQVLVEIYRSFQTERRAADRAPAGDELAQARPRLVPEARARGAAPPAVWVPLPPDVRAPRRRLQHAHVAAGPAGRGRRWRDERLRRTRSRRRSRAPVSTATSTRVPSTPSNPTSSRSSPASVCCTSRPGRASPSPSTISLDLVDPFADAARELLLASPPVDVLHANYWLSGAVAHKLKHELDLPLVATFHTLARVKADAGLEDDPELRARIEHEVVACADLMLASTDDERTQLASLYDADPDRIEVVRARRRPHDVRPGDRPTRAPASVSPGAA